MSDARWSVREQRLIAGLVASLISSAAPAAPISGQGTWEATLQARDLDGNLSTAEAYYDTALNITWLADANLAATTGFAVNGQMNWDTAMAWVASLNPYGSGITGWRLPTMTDKNPPGCDFAYTGTDCGYNVDTATGEMAYMFYVTLGDKAYYNSAGVGPQPGWGPTNTGPFSNVVPTNGLPPTYWYSTEYSINTAGAWFFDLSVGYQGSHLKPVLHFAWPVHTGAVGRVIAADTDGDGVPDAQDNCVNVPNNVTTAGGPAQFDANGDGYGNRCDPDITNDGVVNINDINLLKSFLTYGHPGPSGPRALCVAPGRVCAPWA